MNRLKSIILLAFSFIAVASYAQKSIDWGEVVPGELYEFQGMIPVSGYYTPTESGMIRCYSVGDVIHIYDDEDFQNRQDYTQSYYSPAGELVTVYPVVAGKTIYLGNPIPIDNGTFRLSVGKDAVEVSHILPSPDQVLSISDHYNAEIAFNVTVKCSRCRLQINGETAEVSPGIIDSYVMIDWFGPIRQWYREGKINEGDILTLTLTGVRDEYDSSNRPNFGHGAGTLVVEYKMASAPAELVGQSGTPASGTPDFMSYYLPGSDSGLVSLEFSKTLNPACGAIAEVQYYDEYDIEAGTYVEAVPVKIEGNTVNVNLQGVARLPEKMVPGLPVQSDIHLVVYNIKSDDGQYVVTGQASNPYAFNFKYNLKTVTYSVAADWLPLPGSALASGDDMEIWVLNGQHIMFDSVDFSYVKDGERAVASVPYADLKVSPDYSDAMIYNLKAPAIDADPDTEITVTFGGLLCADGIDHSSDIFVRYKSSTSGVDLLPSVSEDGVYYDLTGRRVQSPTKGIYILNGKKVVIK